MLAIGIDVVIISPPSPFSSSPKEKPSNHLPRSLPTTIPTLPKIPTIPTLLLFQHSLSSPPPLRPQPPVSPLCPICLIRPRGKTCSYLPFFLPILIFPIFPWFPSSTSLIHHPCLQSVKLDISRFLLLLEIWWWARISHENYFNTLVSFFEH